MQITKKDILTLIPAQHIITTNLDALDDTSIIGAPSIDTRTIEKNMVFFAFDGENSDGHSFIKEAYDKGASLVIGSKPIDSFHTSTMSATSMPGAYIQVHSTLETLQAMATIYREKYISSTTIVGVTGSVGKTTVKDMLTSATKCLSPFATKGNLNNHIGVPLTILSIPVSTSLAILEAGMNHRGEMKILAKIMQPDIVVITHIGVAHIEYLKTRDEIAVEKLDLAVYSPKARTVLIPADDSYANFIEATIHKLHKNGREISCIKTTRSGPDNLTIGLPGIHMKQNAYLAYSVAKILGVVDTEIVSGLATATITPRRLEIHKLPNGSIFIDDSYNANTDSVKAGLTVCNEYNGDVAFDNRIAILGGMAELGEQSHAMHQEIFSYISTLKNITKTYFVGELAKKYIEKYSYTNSDASLLKTDYEYFKTIDDFFAEFKIGSIPQSKTLYFIKGSKSTHMSDLADLILHELDNPIK